MYTLPDSPEQHHQRSIFIKSFVKRLNPQAQAEVLSTQHRPRSIIQFWHDALTIPADVQECIDSWRRWTEHGFTHRVFNYITAEEFISRKLGPIYQLAFKRCYHPAMQADYFRLCYLYVEGGFYVDADDICVADNIDFLFTDNRVKIQPLCYDLATGKMVEPKRFLDKFEDSPDWIYYFNNNPLVAESNHPVIAEALERSTAILSSSRGGSLPEIQETTGPGNLSKILFEMGKRGEIDESVLLVLRSWETTAVSKWPLSYRSDMRNWRLSNQQTFIKNENCA